ncbi:hypothetical protein BKA69DRAFT_1049748 [Paraphysoderma sedebokerense]|nr:hypothetical protein BKA69DRAFT_1049748 [Paraphysoderma sedebokerense]
MSKVFTQAENDTIQLLVRIAASLSIIGSVGIISDFLLNRDKRFKSPNRVVFWLSISDFFFSCCLFLARWPTSSPLFCTIQGFFIQYFVLCATLWNGSIAINLLITILLRKGSAYVLSIEKYYHIVCWSFPFLVTFPWLFGGLQFKGARFFNDADMWCWIANDYKEFRMWLFYVPIWVIFLFNLIIYVLVGRVLWNATNQVNATSASSRTGRSKSNRMSRMTTGTTSGISGRKRIRNGIRDKLQDPRIKYGVKTSFYLLGFFLTWFV